MVRPGVPGHGRARWRSGGLRTAYTTHALAGAGSAGLRLLDPEDHDLLDMHWKGHTDAEIGEQLGIQANTARMRRNRVVARLGKVIFDLQQGRVDAALAAGGAEALEN